MPCPSSAMSSGRLFLDGSLASVARLRFTGIISLKPCPAKANDLPSNGTCLLTVCLSRGDKRKSAADTCKGA
jgi:hypothetical protein